MQGLGCEDALREVDRHVKASYFWVVEGELQSYFATGPTPPLLAKGGRREPFPAPCSTHGLRYRSVFIFVLTVVIAPRHRCQAEHDPSGSERCARNVAGDVDLAV